MVFPSRARTGRGMKNSLAISGKNDIGKQVKTNAPPAPMMGAAYLLPQPCDIGFSLSYFFAKIY